MKRIAGVIDRNDNNLLRALRVEDWAILQLRMELRAASTGAVLHEPGDAIQHAYFPCGSSLVSYLVVLEDGRAIETAMVGREGAVGGIVSHGRLPAYSRAVVQLGGNFYRINLRDLEEAKARSATLRNLFARYSDCLLAQVFQSVACNAAHTLEQRTAKWLLAAIERTGAADVALTQEQLAAMLGVGRSYLSRVMQDLRFHKVVDTRRKHIAVTNVDGLRALACKCNSHVSRHFEDVLKGVYPID